MTKYLLECEKTWDQILIKPNFCYYCISLEMVKELYKTAITSPEFEKEIFNIQDERYKNYIKNARQHIGIYSEDGIREFIETGKLSDHLPFLRPFTTEEAKRALREIISVSERLPNNRIYILKKNLVYNQYQYSFFGDHYLSFGNSKADYTNANFSFIKNSDDTVKAFYNFIHNELIPKFCYTYDESIDILKKYL